MSGALMTAEALPNSADCGASLLLALLVTIVMLVASSTFIVGVVVGRSKTMAPTQTTTTRSVETTTTRSVDTLTTTTRSVETQTETQTPTPLTTTVLPVAPAERVYVCRYGRKYHRRGCIHARTAIMQYDPCLVCS